MAAGRGAGYFRVPRGWTRKGFTLALSSDSARHAVMRLWDVGKDVGGSFSSEAELREAMGAYRRFIPEFREKGWLDGLDIHDWGQDQADADPTAAERQRRRRDKLATKRDNPVTVTRDARDMSRPLTETETETEISEPNGSSVQRGGRTSSTDIDTAWSAYVEGTGRARAVLTDTVRKLISRTLKTYGLAITVGACYGWQYDDWDRRPQNIRPEDIWRPGNIERFAEWHEAGDAPRLPGTERQREQVREIRGFLDGYGKDPVLTP